MIEAAKAARGELILVILGPLTNVALACKLDPQLPSRGQALRMSPICTYAFAVCSLEATAKQSKQITVINGALGLWLTHLNESADA